MKPCLYYNVNKVKVHIRLPLPLPLLITISVYKYIFIVPSRDGCCFVVLSVIYKTVTANPLHGNTHTKKYPLNWEH